MCAQPGGVPVERRTVPDPLVPEGLLGWARRLFSVIRPCVLRLVMVQLVMAALGALLAVLRSQLGTSSYDVIGLGLLLVSAIVVVAGHAVSMVVVVRTAAGESARLTDAVRLVARRAGRLLGWTVLFGVLAAIGVVAYVLVVLSVGFETDSSAAVSGVTSLFVIPVGYLVTVFGSTLFGVVLVERAGVGRCLALVHPRFWRTAVRMVLAAVAAVCARYVVVAADAVSGGAVDDVSMQVLDSLATVVIGLLAVAVSVVTYAELRHREDPSVNVASLVAQLRS